MKTLIIGEVINKNLSSKNYNFFELDNLNTREDYIKLRAETDSEALKRKFSNKYIYQKMANSVFKSFEDRKLIVPESQPISLENASEAHEILESRMGGGSLYLKP